MVNPEVSTKEVVTVYRERSQVIAEYTKNRANGICDLCGKEAPFKDKNGKPYLESHHVITLANDGPDAIYNTVAICPNCHRRIHVLKSKEDTEKLGVEWCIQQCKELIAYGVPSIHFYSVGSINSIKQVAKAIY